MDFTQYVNTNSGTISNCFVEVEITSDNLKSAMSAGGIAGTNDQPGVSAAVPSVLCVLYGKICRS